MDEKKMLSSFMELFPTEGQVVPLVELKFRLASQYGAEDLEKMLEKLEEEGVLSRFEFNNTVHYKAKKEIPIALGEEGRSSSEGSSDDGGKLAALSDLVVTLAEASDDPDVKDVLNGYKSEYL